MEAKPPALLQNIAWFLAHWREHKLVIAIAIVVASLPAIYSGANAWLSGAKVISSAPNDRKDNANSQNSGPALKVHFRDGSFGYVELGFSFALDPASAPRVYENYGDQRRAVADLREAVEGTVYRLMEPLTIDEARLHREQIEAAIIEQTKGAQSRTGHTIYQVTLKRIEQTR